MKSSLPALLVPPQTNAPPYNAIFDALGRQHLADLVTAFEAAPSTYEPKADFAYGLYKAATEGDSHLAFLLLEWGARPDQGSESPLRATAYRGTFEC